VRLAEQQRELDRVVVAYGLDRRVQRDAGVTVAPAVFAGHDAADAADVNLASVKGDGPEVNPDVTGETAGRRLDQHAQVGVGPFDVSPLFEDMRRPDRLE
jgi:hypothetical protein